MMRTSPLRKIKILLLSSSYLLILLSLFLVNAQEAVPVSVAKTSLLSPYDFIFGFSTGRVGTTTLSEKKY